MRRKLSEIMNNMQVDVPLGKSGKWEVKYHEITQRDVNFSRLRAATNPQRSNRGWTHPGIYTMLCHRGATIMTDTHNEIQDNMELFWNAKGHVLVNGLGLGVVLGGLFQIEGVDKVTAVEISQDVLNLVADHYQQKFGDRLEIIHADALEWKPPKGVRYEAVWHDIWPTICADHLPDMHKLHRKYGRRCDWQGSWCRAEMEQQNQTHYGGW